MSELRRGDGTAVEWKLCCNKMTPTSPPCDTRTYIIRYPDGTVHKWMGTHVYCYLGFTIPNGSEWIPNSRTIWKYLTKGRK